MAPAPSTTCFHYPNARLRALRTLDHIAIYFLIAGTYTPVALLTLHSPLGWALLGTVWLIAFAGIPFKLFFLDAPAWLSTATYLGMGYLALLAIVPLLQAVSLAGVAWLVAGGVAYTVGAVIYTGSAGSRSRGASATMRSGICWCWPAAPATSPSWLYHVV